MKKNISLFIIILTVNNCLAQKTINMLKNTNYLCVSSNRKIAEMEKTKDSISIVTKLNNHIIYKKQYQIVYEEERSQYSLIYVKKTGMEKSRNTFGVFVFDFSKNKDKLRALQDVETKYLTLEAVKADYLHAEFESKYFYTWYNNEIFKTFLNYPDLINADKNTIKDIVDKWVKELRESTSKVQNTNNNELYSAQIGQDILTKILISLNINPLESISDLNKKAVQYEISIPQIQILHKKVIATENTGNSKGIHINAPQSN